MSNIVLMVIGCAMISYGATYGAILAFKKFGLWIIPAIVIFIVLLYANIFSALFILIK